MAEGMIIRRGGKTSDTIDTWEPNPLWPNLKTIIDNDTEDYVGKVAVLYASGHESFDFDLSAMQSQAVKTSDGAFYTTDTLHTWDTSQDIDEGNGLKVRWVIWYYSDTTSASITSNDELFKHKPKWIVVGSNGTTFNWRFDDTFNRIYHNTYLEAIDHHSGGVWDTSSVTNMSNMFNYCSSLRTIPLFDTSSVTNMNAMFSNCGALKTVPLFDTSSVTNMSVMFNRCSALKTIPLLETSLVTTMSNMFNRCSALKTIPLLDTSSVTNMISMFRDCEALKTVPLLDTSSVVSMASMFSSCSSLETIPLLDTPLLVNTSSMFSSCSSLRTMASLDTSSVTSMNNMFSNCQALRKVSIDTSSASNVSALFQTCILLEDIGEINLSSVNSINTLTFSFGAFSNVGYEVKATFVPNTINRELTISTPSLTYDSLISLIGGLVDRSSTTSLNIVLGGTNIAKLTQADLDLITGKNWTYS